MEVEDGVQPGGSLPCWQDSVNNEGKGEREAAWLSVNEHSCIEVVEGDGSDTSDSAIGQSDSDGSGGQLMSVSFSQSISKWQVGGEGSRSSLQASARTETAADAGIHIANMAGAAAASGPGTLHLNITGLPSQASSILNLSADLRFSHDATAVSDVEEAAAALAPFAPITLWKEEAGEDEDDDDGLMEEGSSTGSPLSCKNATQQALQLLSTTVGEVLLSRLHCLWQDGEWE